MKKYNIFQFLIVISSLFGLSSCSDYLSVEDTFSMSDSKAYILSDPAQQRRFQRAIYEAMPNYSNYAGASADGLGNPWASMSDELSNNANGGTLQSIGTQGYTSSSAASHRWQALYRTIRTASLYINGAKVSGNVGDPDFMGEAELKSLKAECYFFRAYSYYLLLEQYGPIPVLDQVADPSDATSDYERNSVDEVIAAIEKDLAIAITDLDPTRTSTTVASGFEESRLSIPTIGVALALRAKMLVLTASPLYNGGYPEGLALTNNDGKKLFPNYDASKWVKAKSALKDLLVYADAGNYQLYKSATNDANLHIYELFQKYNKEIIWGNSKQSWSVVEAAQTPRDITVVAGGSSGSTLGVTQEMVDAFFMKNGLGITDAGSGYLSTGFSNVVNPATRFIKSGVTVSMTDSNVLNAYANREPRFYAAVTYQGKSWHDVVSNTALQGTTALTSKATKVLFARDVPSSLVPFPGYGGIANNDNRRGGFPKTGYLCYKNSNRTVHPTVPSGIRSVFRPAIIFRLADFYLLYAEVANEVNPSDPDIVKYLDLVRDRAGIPGYVTMQGNGTKTGVIGNKNAMRNAIIAERRIELFTEGQRYFDVRRWMIADKPEGRQGGFFTGMNMNGNGSDLTYFQKINIDNAPRKFDRAMYLYPIQLSQMSNSKKLVQNPGW